MVAIAVAVLIAAPATLVRAQTVIWDGSTDTTWTGPTDTTSWGGGVDTTYNDGDDVAFLGAGTGTVTIAGTVTPGSITVSNTLGNDYTISGTIAGADAVTKDGAGTLTLSGSDSNYNGIRPISVNGGVMEVLGQEYSWTLNIDNGATYRATLGSVPRTLNFGSNGGGTLITDGNLWNMNMTVTTTGGAENFISGGTWNAIIQNRVYTFNVADGTDASDFTLSTSVADNWPRILKNGGGTLTLTSSVNNRIAPTEVDQGTLLFNGTSIATPVGATYYGDPVTVNNTGTLGGTGTIIDPVSVLAGGTLAAGDTNSIGALTLDDGLTFADASATNVVRVTGVGAAQQNKVVVTGGAITLGSATLVIDDTGVSDLTSEPIIVIDNQAASAVSGTFDGLAEGAKVSGINGSEWTISYTGGTGNDVVLTLPAQGTVILIK